MVFCRIIPQPDQLNPVVTPVLFVTDADATLAAHTVLPRANVVPATSA
jgi:hypothetical protein